MLQTDITILKQREKVLEKEIDEALSHTSIDDLMIAHLKSRILYQNDKLSPITPTATTMDRQSSSQDATNGSVPYYATAPAPLEQDAHNVTEPSDVTVDGSNNKVGEFRQQEPLEQPRKRARRNYRPFHLHFGAFRF